MFLIVFAICVISLLAWYQVKYGKRNALLAKIPAPKKYPFLHNAFEFYGKTPQEIFAWLEKAKESLGSVYHVTYEPFENGSVLVSDPKIAEGILTSQKLLDKSEDYDFAIPWLGTGLLISTGKKWFQRRKILTPAFHFQILEKFVEIMDEQGNLLIEKLKKLDGKEENIYPLIKLYTLDVICESAMGCKINAQSENSEYVKAVKDISEIIFDRIYSPINRFDFFYKFTKLYQQEVKTLKVLHDFTDNVITARRDELLNRGQTDEVESPNGTKRKMALLDILLQSTVDDQPLANEDIREEVDTFMFAGHDTTTSGISFCLYNIAKYPEVQQKVFEEIRKEISDDEALTLSHISKLRYLELVIKETLRLYPSVPYFARRLTEEVMLEGYTFPKGCNLAISPYLMGRDPEIFPDPLAFTPERFDVETTVEKINPYAYVPFSAGSRNCIGQKFAMNEMKLVICKIIRNFELVLKDNEDLGLYQDLVLKTSNGINLRIQKRK